MFVFESEVRMAQEVLDHKTALCIDDFIRVTRNLDRMNDRIELINSTLPDDQLIELFELKFTISDIRDAEKVKLVGKITGPAGFTAGISAGGLAAVSTFLYACQLAVQSGLSGGAIITNALAWLGGGSIASGGGGMVGGLMSLGMIGAGVAALVGLGIGVYNLSVNAQNLKRVQDATAEIMSMHSAILDLDVMVNRWYENYQQYRLEK